MQDTQIYTGTAVELVSQRVTRRRLCITIMLTLDTILINSALFEYYMEHLHLHGLVPFHY